MSHYLSRLAARAVAAPTVVRPQLPSLFEPIKAAEAFPVSQPPDRMDFAQPEMDQNLLSEKPAISTTASGPVRPAGTSTPPGAIPEPHRAPRTQAQMPPPPTGPFDVLQVEVNAVESPRPAERVDAPLKVPGLAPERVASGAAPQIAPAVAAEFPDRRQREATAVRQREATAVRQSEATAVRQSERSGVERRDLRVVSSDASPAAPVSAPPSSPIPAAATGPLTPVRSAVRAPAKAAFAGAPDHSAPPAVHVTIGRVEVRAILPPAPVAPATPRRTPKISLDEYLRSRSGGGGA